VEEIKHSYQEQVRLCEPVAIAFWAKLILLYIYHEKKMLHPTLNNLAFLKAIAVSNFRRLSFPFKCSFAVTYRCNLRCRMCNIWRKPQPMEAGDGESGELSLDLIDNFFAHARDFSWIGLTGGEPFLRSDIQEIAAIATGHSRRLCALHFATNGSLTDRVISVAENIIARHKKLQLVFTVSIDGDPALHDGIRGLEGLWNRAVATFTGLKKLPNVKAQVGYTISNHNAGHFAEAYGALRSAYPALQFDDINVNVFQKSGFYYENQDMENLDVGKMLEDLRAIIAQDRTGFTLNNFLRRTYLKFYPDYCATGKSPVPCQALASTFFMDPSGDVYPCAVYKRKLMNIRDLRDDFGRVWTSPAARQIHEECRTNRCPVCWSPCDAFSAIGSSLPRSLLRYV
jgi:radical SAM protein with 4Fe4S-binding SPASM domain